MNKFNWSAVDNRIMYVATDEDGNSYGYPAKPYTGDSGWWESTNDVILSVPVYASDTNWKDSLMCRNEQVVEEAKYTAYQLDSYFKYLKVCSVMDLNWYIANVLCVKQKQEEDAVKLLTELGYVVNKVNV